MNSLGYPPNPLLNADGTPSDAAPAAAKRGYQIFTVKAASRSGGAVALRGRRLSVSSSRCRP